MKLHKLEDRHIIIKLSPYGILQTNTIFNHKYRGTEIYNGIRSGNFTTIVKPIPTTIFVRGNRLKLKHEGQDRTPICGICKEKGHYRNDCPRKELHTYTDKDTTEDNRQEQNTWSNIVKQGIEQRERKEEQRRLCMEEIKKQEEQNKQKRRQEEIIQDDLTQRLNQIIEDNENQEEQWGPVEDTAKRRRKKRRKKEKKEEDKKKKEKKHHQIQQHHHRSDYETPEDENTSEVSNSIYDTEMDDTEHTKTETDMEEKEEE